LGPLYRGIIAQIPNFKIVEKRSRKVRTRESPPPPSFQRNQRPDQGPVAGPLIPWNTSGRKTPRFAAPICSEATNRRDILSSAHPPGGERWAPPPDRSAATSCPASLCFTPDIRLLCTVQPSISASGRPSSSGRPRRSRQGRQTPSAWPSRRRWSSSPCPGVPGRGDRGPQAARHRLLVPSRSPEHKRPPPPIGVPSHYPSADPLRSAAVSGSLPPACCWPAPRNAESPRPGLQVHFPSLGPSTGGERAGRGKNCSVTSTKER